MQLSNPTENELIEILPDGTRIDPNNPYELSEFVNDQWLANQIGMKIATIRSQRFKRLHGYEHWLDIDPVYIGSKPRYRRSEALDWLKRQPLNRNSSE